MPIAKRAFRKTRSYGEIPIFSLLVIYRDPVVNFRGRRLVPFTRSVYAMCVSRIRESRIRAFPAKSFRHRARTATSLARSSAETSCSLVSPQVSFLLPRVVFSFYPLAFFLAWFSFTKNGQSYRFRLTQRRLRTPGSTGRYCMRYTVTYVSL